MIFWPKRYVYVGPLHFSPLLNALIQGDLSLKLFSLCLRGDGHATSDDYVNLPHLILIIGIGLAMFTSTEFLGHRCWWWHLFAIQKSFTLFQIVSGGTMDLAPLFYVSRVMELSFLLLIRGFLLMIPVISMIFVIPVISMISAIPMISTIGSVDQPIILLLLRGPLATLFKEPSPGLGGFNAYISDCEQIGYCFGLLHSDFLNSLDIAHTVMKGIDDLDVLNVRNIISGVPEMFHVVLEVFIMLLLDGH
jgi:hypothetical protein